VNVRLLITLKVHKQTRPVSDEQTRPSLMQQP